MRKKSLFDEHYVPSVRQRKDGRWEARYLDPTTGKRMSSYGNNREECSSKATLAYEKIKKGIYSKPSSITLGEWLVKWYSAHSLQVKQSTRIEYDRYIKKRIAPSIGNIRMRMLT